MELDECRDVTFRRCSSANSPHTATGNSSDRGKAAVSSSRWIGNRDHGKRTVDPLQDKRIVVAGCRIDGPADYPRRAIVSDSNGEGIVFTRTLRRGWHKGKRGWRPG